MNFLIFTESKMETKFLINLSANSPISSWKKFAKKVRPFNDNLLFKLADFENPILITGCQRSGTTILTNIILSSSEIYDYRQGGDSELEGALILSGNVSISNKGDRSCCQTTYLNEKFPEYYKYIGAFKLIFIVRNPFSVVYSMCYHWRRKIELTNFALNELFDSCGSKLLNDKEMKKYNIFGSIAISSFRKACLSYIGKTSQVFELKNKLGEEAIAVIDYDDFISQKESVLRFIFDFVELPYSLSYTDLIHTKGIKRADKLTENEKRIIQQTCWPTYEKVRRLAEDFYR